MVELDLARLVRGTRRLASRHGVAVVDTGAGLGQSVVALASAADAVVVVATPEPTSITDAYAMIKCLHRGGTLGVISILVNRAANEQEAHAVCGKIASVADRFLGFRPLFAGWVPEDPAVLRAVRARRPFLLSEPASPSSKALMRLAETVAATCGNRQSAERAESRSLFGTLSAWLGRSEGESEAQACARGSRGLFEFAAGITKSGRAANR
jgi:flagellar biosynthesis protein FlhG